MKRILSIILATLCILLAVSSVSAVTPQSNRIYRCADSSGAYVVRFSGKHAVIEYYSSRNYTIGLDLLYTISAVCSSRGKIVLFCDDAQNNQAVVYVYYLNTDMLDSFAVSDMHIYSDTDLSCDDRAIYIENHRNHKELISYSYDGNLMKRYQFSEEITDAFNTQNGLYAITNDTLWHLTSDRFHLVSGASVQPPLFPADSDVIASVKGNVYVTDGDTVVSTFSVDTDFQAASACVVGNRLYYPCGSVINGYDLDTGEKVSAYRLSYPVFLVYADGNAILTVGDGNSTLIKTELFTELNQQTDENSEGRNEESYTGQVDNNPSSGDLSTISSDLYHVDLDDYYITGIPTGTTISQFKSHMWYNGYSLNVYRDGNLKKSGQVGTAMTVVFTRGGSRITFELGVTGDITGEGNCNTRDLNLLLDSLIGAASFNGVYTIAADVTSDGHVDLLDAVTIKCTI